jgi:hypothetical protein
MSNWAGAGTPCQALTAAEVRTLTRLVAPSAAPALGNCRFMLHASQKPGLEMMSDR